MRLVELLGLRIVVVFVFEVPFLLVLVLGRLGIELVWLEVDGKGYARRVRRRAHLGEGLVEPAGELVETCGPLVVDHLAFSLL